MNVLPGANVPAMLTYLITKSRKTTTPRAVTRKNARIGAIDTYHHALKQGRFNSRAALVKRKTRS